ncbi:hypothetical protein E2C01_007292 [Portunus trituberculatus]|uniref:Uncharacterized protein n=1 Tax=Portunus trituberculatus TaxID=210409 RepID=A0A5B7D0J8_PORTR|nr:hypothetical protein [Portunus trituberculatus]
METKKDDHWEHHPWSKDWVEKEVEEEDLGSMEKHLMEEEDAWELQQSGQGVGEESVLEFL